MDNLLLRRRAIAPKENSLSGNMPLSFDARRMPLKSLVREGKCEQRNLPIGYTQLEYIESTGDQWIDTGIVPSGNKMRFRIDYTPLSLNSKNRSGSSVTNSFMVMDASQSSSARSYIDYLYSGTQTTYLFSSGALKGDNAVVGQRRLVDFTSEDGSQSLSIDGTVVETKTNSYDASKVSAQTKSFYLFGEQYYSTSSPADKKCSIKLYSCKVWESDVLIADYVPAKNSSNVLGLYNKVNGAFLTNQGTGSFTAGPDVVPTPSNPMDIWCNNGVLKCVNPSGIPLAYQELESIQTDGNSWIDTGITPTATTLQIDYKMQLVQKGYTSLFGSVANPAPKNGFRIYYHSTYSETTVYLQSGGTSANQAITWDAVLQGSAVVRNGVSIVSTINGQTSTFTNSSVNLTNPASIYIGTSQLGTTGGTSGKDPSKIFSFKITKDSVVVFNGVPAKRKSDNVLGLYDKVSGTFLTNAGTGTFTAGTVIGPKIVVEGTPEVLSLNNDTASVQNLFSVGSYKDTQDLITGEITRKCGVCYYDGTQDVGDMYISTTGGKDTGAIIVYPLATETTESVTPQALNSAAGSNTLSSTANVQSPQATVKYFK